MLKFIIIIISILTLFSFSLNKKQENTKFSKLSKFYKDTIFNELLVYPDINFDDSKYFFKGKEIDSKTFSLLSNKATNEISWDQGFYGIYSFNLNNQYKGLLTRTPGEYSASSISLWIYDLKNDSVTNNIQIVDILGDAGESVSTNTYLYFDKTKKLNAFTYRYYSYENGVGDEYESDTTIEVYHSYYLIRINSHSVDTLSTDSVKLCQQFKSQLKMMTKY